MLWECESIVNQAQITHVYVWNDNTNRNWYYLNLKAYIQKKNISVYKNVNIDTNWKDPMIPIDIR